jgi:hypothetical protein
MDSDDAVDINSDTHRDERIPGFVEDGDRFDRPVPNRRVQKIVRSIAALVLASMLAAAGTPLSWVSITTTLLMILIWTELWSKTFRDDDDVI